LDSFGIDATFEPFLAVLHLPKGKGMDTPDGQALASRTFNSAEKAGIVAVADYANSQNPVFLPGAPPTRVPVPTTRRWNEGTILTETCIESIIVLMR
jgi:hypothetical protein